MFAIWIHVGTEFTPSIRAVPCV